MKQWRCENCGIEYKEANFIKPKCPSCHSSVCTLIAILNSSNHKIVQFTSRVGVSELGLNTVTEIRAVVLDLLNNEPVIVTTKEALVGFCRR